MPGGLTSATRVHLFATFLVPNMRGSFSRCARPPRPGNGSGRSSGGSDRVGFVVSHLLCLLSGSHLGQTLLARSCGVDYYPQAMRSGLLKVATSLAGLSEQTGAEQSRLVLDGSESDARRSSQSCSSTSPSRMRSGRSAGVSWEPRARSSDRSWDRGPLRPRTG